MRTVSVGEIIRFTSKAKELENGKLSDDNEQELLHQQIDSKTEAELAVLAKEYDEINARIRMIDAELERFSWENIFVAKNKPLVKLQETIQQLRRAYEQSQAYASLARYSVSYEELNSQLKAHEQALCDAELEYRAVEHRIRAEQDKDLERAATLQAERDHYEEQLLTIRRQQVILQGDTKALLQMQLFDEFLNFLKQEHDRQSGGFPAWQI